MAFEVLFNDANTGEPKVAHVSFFVWEDDRLAAIYSVKGEASERVLEMARRELDNFVLYVRTAQLAPETGRETLNLDGRPAKLRVIDTDALRKIVCGPRGSRKLGFDEELRLSHDELLKIAQRALDESNSQA